MSGVGGGELLNDRVGMEAALAIYENALDGNHPGNHSSASCPYGPPHEDIHGRNAHEYMHTYTYIYIYIYNCVKLVSGPSSSTIKALQRSRLVSDQRSSTTFGSHYTYIQSLPNWCSSLVSYIWSWISIQPTNGF